MKYASVVCGGTFDGLHKGHEALLTKAFAVGERVTIGLTTDEYVSKYKLDTLIKEVQERTEGGHKNIPSYFSRKRALMAWLEKRGWLKWAEILPIDDPYGNTIPPTGVGYDAIVVSADTKKTAAEINRQREHAGWKQLEVVSIPMVLAEDGKPIASSRLRNKEIDRSGHIILPDILRPVLRMPLGKLMIRDVDIDRFVNAHKDRIFVTVGDMATKRFLDMGFIPSLAVIDLHVRRRRFQPFEAYNFPEGVPVTRVKSGPGYLSQEAMDAVKEWGKGEKQAQVIIVEGEEDLLVLPVVVNAKLKTMVYYGQPGEGMVAVEVTRAKQQEIQQLLRHFIQGGKDRG